MKLNTELTPRSLKYTRYQIDHNCALRVHLVVEQFNKGSLTTVTKVMRCRCGRGLPLALYPGHVGSGKHYTWSGYESKPAILAELVG